MRLLLMSRGDTLQSVRRELLASLHADGFGREEICDFAFLREMAVPARMASLLARQRSVGSHVKVSVRLGSSTAPAAAAATPAEPTNDGDLGDGSQTPPPVHAAPASSTVARPASAASTRLVPVPVSQEHKYVVADFVCPPEPSPPQPPGASPGVGGGVGPRPEHPVSFGPATVISTAQAAQACRVTPAVATPWGAGAVFAATPATLTPFAPPSSAAAGWGAALPGVQQHPSLQCAVIIARVQEKPNKKKGTR